jgi:predicted DNA-binding antitoxin AbrB/MazE fold protein
MTVKVIYESGVLRPLQPLDLDEGQEIDINLPTIQKRSGPDPDYIERLLTQFAADYEPTGQVDTAGMDHDKILYSERGAR